MNRNRKPLVLITAVLFAGLLIGCSGCDRQKRLAFNSKVTEYEQIIKSLEQKFGQALDDPNMSTATYDAIATELKQQLQDELEIIDQKYAQYIANPNSKLQKGVDQVEKYTPGAQTIIGFLPSPYRELGLTGVGLFTTILASIKSRRKWKTVSEEVLDARKQLIERIEDSDLDTDTFITEITKAEGSALNPPTAKLITPAKQILQKAG